MNLISRLLRKNTSPSRVAGFILSNFIGLAIIIGGVQFYQDAKILWTSDDSFMKSDYLVVNRIVTTSHTWRDSDSGFTKEEVSDLRRQPWVRDVGEFSSTDYRVWASVGSGDRGMSTMMFFESVPDRFVDGRGGDWFFKEGDDVVPVIISKDYLALYNFGFAGSAGLPQMSESIMESIPLRLRLSSFDGSRVADMSARVVGYSSRLNTIIVPESFMAWSNAAFGGGGVKLPSRLIVDVSSPGDVAIREYLDARGLEMAGDKSASSASYLLKVVTGIVLGVGGLITLMSFFILLLSISLLMEKNRDKLHDLLSLGCDFSRVSAPYVRIVVAASAVAYFAALVCCCVLRSYYLDALSGLGAATGNWWAGAVVGAAIALSLMSANVFAVGRRVKRCWRR